MANDQLSDQLNNIGNVVKDNLDSMSSNIGNFANTAADAILDTAPATTFSTPAIDLSAGNSEVREHSLRTSIRNGYFGSE